MALFRLTTSSSAWARSGSEAQSAEDASSVTRTLVIANRSNLSLDIAPEYSSNSPSQARLLPAFPAHPQLNTQPVVSRVSAPPKVPSFRSSSDGPIQRRRKNRGRHRRRGCATAILARLLQQN